MPDGGASGASAFAYHERCTSNPEAFALDNAVEFSLEEAGLVPAPVPELNETDGNGSDDSEDDTGEILPGEGEEGELNETDGPEELGSNETKAGGSPDSKDAATDGPEAPGLNETETDEPKEPGSNGTLTGEPSGSDEDQPAALEDEIGPFTSESSPGNGYQLTADDDNDIESTWRRFYSFVWRKI